jgi:hypothetical protein
LADTAIAITAGSGTNVDTRTEGTNGNHRQVIVVGDPATNAGVAPVDATTGLVVNIAPGIDKGSGTGGSLTQRVIVDSSQLDPTVAHDAVDSGTPYKMGAKAIAGLSGATLVAAADRTDLYAGLDGALITRPHCGLEDLISGVAAITDGSSTSVIASAGAGVKNYVTTAIIANTSATAVTVDLRDGAAGSVKATLPVPANTSGVVCNLPVPLGFSAATAVCADPSSAASTVTVTLIGFKSKV